MKAVVLAAGRGTRIQSITRGRPKCLLPFGDRALIDYQIDGLFQTGAREIAIVVGHERDAVLQHVAAWHPDRRKSIEFVVNPWYGVTNNMYSLWLSRRFVAGESFLCLNADVLCHPEILMRTASGDRPVTLAIDREYRDETTKVVVRDGLVRSLSKGLSKEEASGTFVNVAAFSPEGARALFERAQALFAGGAVNQFFNDVISDLAGANLPVGFCDASGLPWAEIDDARDFVFARASVFPQIETLYAPAAAIGE